MRDNDSNLFPDLESLRLPQGFSLMVGGKRIITTVRVGKPDRQSWIRVHPDPEMRIDTAIYSCREDGGVYLVESPLWSELGNELTQVTIFTAIDTLNTVFLWLIKKPKSDGKVNDWNESNLRGALEAQKQWVRVASNLGRGAYDIFHSPIERPEPEWPKETFYELLQIAFKDRYINSLEHPLVQRLLGKAK
jgi:hypothetical protein